MDKTYSRSEWNQKEGTLSEKTAFKEFGLTEDDIITAINAGRLQFREGSIYGQPYLRLLRSEVEKLAEEKFGKGNLLKSKARTELKKINDELKKMKLRIEELEERKKHLNSIIKA